MPGFQIFKGAGGPCNPGAPGGPAIGPPATIETARQHRFEFAAFDPIDDILLFAHRAGRPSIEIDAVTTHRSQDEVYTPGKQRWRPVEISFYEAVAGIDRVANAIFTWYSGQVLIIGGSTIAGEHKRSASLALLDGVGAPVWTYFMLGTWIERADPSQLDYTDTNIAEITFTLRMDKAVEG